MESASISGAEAVLDVATSDGKRSIAVDHVIAATGYRVNVE